MKVEIVAFVSILHDVREACDELAAGGGEVVGIQDTGVCHMGFCKDPDGNTVILHRRYASRG